MVAVDQPKTLTDIDCANGVEARRAARTSTRGAVASQQGHRRAEARGQQFQRDWSSARRAAAAADDA
ncbi:hypothetical protein Syun_007265 [Stephania yunnanensis]|uniref:Uncharacterized protein n=1 Tax=Stephania yunnanensis TaxID=152371 RepID=A0AAP0KZX6_9MAGN